jgi:GH15 family glucan-1,4-alpha-glucosidase
MNAPQYKPLEEYGIIGNLETCALVGSDGSIDWYCLPELDSPSVFASLLDHHKGGSFSVKPSGPFRSRQKYKGETNILRTIFETNEGTAELTDFMPLQLREGARRHENIEIIRRVECVEGTTRMTMEISPLFDYARVPPTIERVSEGVVFRGAGLTVGLGSSVPLHADGRSARSDFMLKKGEYAIFVLFRTVPQHVSAELCEKLQKETGEYWIGWVHACDRQVCAFEGPWHDAVVRSGLVLKLLTHPETGAIAAAPTTSIPESIGGVRNWDYRYAWVRDSSFTVQALHNLGHVKEAHDFFRWMRTIVQKAKDPSALHIMYGLRGDNVVIEQTLEHLTGYMNSRPVRIGNDASTQRQLDIFGELILALYETSHYGLDSTPSEWELVSVIAEYVSEEWKKTDAGIWEVRGGDRHFTYSKLMCWVAIDRSIRIAERLNRPYPTEKWKSTRADIRSAILAHGYNERRKSFVQSFDSDVLDATSLLIPTTGFLAHDDPRVLSTIDATLRGLTDGSGVYRYIGDDGLPGGEGTFLLCSFWLISALALSGRRHQAEDLLIETLKHSGPTLLFSEEFEVKTGKQLGNFPQAFSHIGLINSALYLGKQSGKAHSGPDLHGLQRIEEK